MDMEMEMESSWKCLFQRRLVLAARHCDSVPGGLLFRTGGLLFRTIKAVDADVQDWRRNEGPCAVAEEAQCALEAASTELGLALASMGAARHIALRGGAPCPSAPLESVDDLAGDPAVWCALERLEKAAELSTRVHDGMERARGHLRAAALLAVLNRVGGGGEEGGCCTEPWEQSPCFSEQLNGAMELGEALFEAEDLAAETAGAREAAFGFIGGGGVK